MITVVEPVYLVEQGGVKRSVLTRIEEELDEPDPLIIVLSLDRSTANTLASIPARRCA